MRSCLLIWMVCFYPATLLAQGANDRVYTLLTTRINENTLKSITATTRLDSLLAALKPDGSWPDINYADPARSRWQPGLHWDRLLLMTQAYRSANHPFYDRADVKTAIQTAIACWNRTKPVSDNYWWNAIGVPQKMGETLLLLADDLPADEQAQTLTLLKMAVRPDHYEFNGTATGQNQIWLATIHLMSGLLERDSVSLRRAFGAMHDEIRVTTAEGIQPDWSFHQHGPLLYAGGYGMAFTRDLAKLIKLADGTPYAFPPTKTTLFSAYVLDGQQWMIRGRTFDHSATGREIARPQLANSKVPGGLATWARMLTTLPIPRQPELRLFAERLAGEAVAPLVGNRHFWRSDFMAHHRLGYYSSVRLASVRTKGSESGNGENGSGYYLGHGLHLLYRTGDEYKNIMPVWDWRHLPGHLCEQAPDPLPLIEWGNGAYGNTSFVSGVSDGQYGLLAGDYQRGNVRAKRAWFHFDTEIVCLGAGLSCPTDYPLTQSLNQCHQNGAVFVADQTVTRKLAAGNHTLPNTRWVLHDSVAYVFPGTATVHVRNDIQTGAWRGINNSPAQSDQVLRLPVFSAWLDFGGRVRNGSYQYIIRPGVSATDMGAYQNPIVILRNDSTMQAVRHTSLNIIQAAFYQSGTLTNALNGLTLSVDKPVLLMARPQPSGLNLTLANPENKPLTVQVRVDGRYTSNACTWSATRRTTTVSVALPTGDRAGQSATLFLKKP